MNDKAAQGESDLASTHRVTPVGYAIRDTLEMFTTAKIADSILREAIATAALSGLPRPASDLYRFVREDLARAVERRLGTRAAEGVQEHLTPVLTAVARLEDSARPSGVHRTFREPEIGLPENPTPVRRAFSVVLVVGTPPADCDALTAAVDRQSAVVPVENARALTETLGITRGEPPMVILDCRNGHEAMTWMGAVGPELLEGAVILLWGESHAERRSLADAFQTARVLECHASASARDIAVLVRTGPM